MANRQGEPRQAAGNSSMRALGYAIGATVTLMVSFIITIDAMTLRGGHGRASGIATAIYDFAGSRFVLVLGIVLLMTGCSLGLGAIKQYRAVKGVEAGQALPPQEMRTMWWFVSGFTALALAGLAAYMALVGPNH